MNRRREIVQIGVLPEGRFLNVEIAAAVLEIERVYSIHETSGLGEIEQQRGSSCRRYTRMVYWRYLILASLLFAILAWLVFG